MDLVLAVLFGLAIVWLLTQDFMKARGIPVPRGVPTLSAMILVLILGIDWFIGRRHILGDPGGFIHTVVKLFLGFLLITLVGSGLTAISLSRNMVAVFVNIIWSGALVLLVLRFMGVL